MRGVWRSRVCFVLLYGGIVCARSIVLVAHAPFSPNPQMPLLTQELFFFFCSSVFVTDDSVHIKDEKAARPP